jgi:hypothetical protein
MSGPYDYVPPDYWLLDNSPAAPTVNTETSPGLRAITRRAEDVHSGRQALAYQ